jgi:2-polyprenyl-3-methyl-5-hydroxy-6-metoxy-1,4-benzoquinol methylase
VCAAFLASLESPLRRDRQPELMDQPGLGIDEHVRALRGLGRINFLSRTSAVLWQPIARLARESGSAERPIRVLDLAAGGGDTAIGLARRALRSGLPVEIDGCDISSQAVQYAQEQAKTRGVCARFFVLDALNESLPQDYDILSCSLFLHHLDEDEAIALLGRMAAATRRIVLVDDLIRSRLGYLLALVGTHLLSGSRVVHVDGPLSVRAAFTPGEARMMAERAGLRGANLRRHWPERYLLTWSVA